MNIIETSKAPGILIIDDSIDKILLLESMFRGLNIDIVSADSGSDGLRKLKVRDFACILLDVKMPIMDGFETADLIRKYHKSRNTPILFITALIADEIDMRKGYSLGAVDFIFAPIVPEVLQAKVRVFIELFENSLLLKKQTEELNKANFKLSEYSNLLKKNNEELEIRVQRRTEEALQSEKKYRDIIETSLVGVYSTSINGEILYINDAVVQMMEAESAEEYISLSIRSLYKNPADWDILIARLQESGTITDFQMYLITKKGNVLTVLISAKLQKDVITGMIIDITSRHKAERDIIKANRIYAVLSNINHTLVHVQDKQTLYNETCRIAVADGKFRMAWIGVIDERLNKFIPVAADGCGEDVKTLIIDLNDHILGNGLIGLSINSGVYYLANDIASDPGMLQWSEQIIKLGCKSFITLPFNVFGHTIGAFQLYSEEPFFFDEIEVKLLEEVVMDIAFAIESIQTQQLIVTQRDLGVELNSIISLKELYNVSIEAFRKLIGTDRGGIYLSNSETRGMDLVFSKGLSERFAAITSRYEADSEVARLVDTGKPAFIELVESPFHQNDSQIEEKLATLVVLPLIYKGVSIGSINLATHEKITLSNNMLKGIEDIAVLVSNALGRIRNEEEIRNNNANLEMLVEERTQQLEVINRNLHNKIEERDIIERKVKESETALIEAQNIAKMGSWEWNIVTGRHKWSDNFFTLRGLKPNEIEPSMDNFSKAIFSEDVCLFEEFLTGLMNGKKADGLELRIIHSSGSIKWVKCLIVPNLENNVITKLSGVIVDITERKLFEEEISKARYEAERANIAKSDFLSRMSHELRTPLNSILGFAQMMEMSELIPAHKKRVGHIMQSGKHLLGLINEVLDIARIESGHISISIEPIKLRCVITEALDILRPLAEKMVITLELSDSKFNDLFVKADKQLLKQVLLNLINNAIKYNRVAGKVKIECELSDGGKEKRVRIKVIDTGLGIPPEEITKLFTPFERIGAEQTPTEGTGLGLAVVKSIMTVMGGKYGVDSEIGQGSVFWVELSLTKSPAAAKPLGNSVINKTAITERIGTILYIEDNLPNIQLVEDILAAYRPTIRLVSEMYGRRAVKLAADYLPDLILLDLDLPDIHGGEVLKLLQSNAKTASIPVIILSADAMSRKIEQFMQYGAKHYFTKPLDVVVFLKVLDEWMINGDKQKSTGSGE